MATVRVILAAVVVMSALAMAQTVEVKSRPLTDDEINLLRKDLQAAKNDVIRDTMQFTEAETAAFWPVYHEYAQGQTRIAKKRLDLITEYAQNLDKMDDVKASSLSQRLFEIEDETQALRKQYFEQFQKALGAKRAAKFYQVDNRLTMITNVQLASEIPLIP